MQTQMINMQELKKKTYTMGEASNRIDDPIIYSCKLSSTRKQISELKIL